MKKPENHFILVFSCTMTETQAYFGTYYQGIEPPSMTCIDTIVVHDHDVLSGRGISIAEHPGNERFRTLITTSFRDKLYCTTYSVQEKKALAEEIIAHIQSLQPPS